MGVEAVTATAKATPVKAAVLTVLSDPETRFAVEMARLHARGDLEAAIGRVKAATGGREAASALSSQLKRVDGTVVPYVTRTEAKAALNTGVSFERADHVELAEQLLTDLGGLDEDTNATGRVVAARGSLWSVEDDGLWHSHRGEAVRARVQGYAGSPVGPKRSPLSIRFGDTASTLRAAMDRLASEGHFDGQVEGVPFANGLLPSEGTFRAYESDDRVMADQVLPVAFDPDATCPRFLQFLGEIYEDESDVAARIGVLREFIGAALLGVATRYQKALFLVGEGENGKSVLLHVIEHLFNPASVVSLPPQKLSGGKSEYYAARLATARLNVVNEMPPRDLLESETVKAAITGDVICGRNPCERPFEFTPIAAWIIAANELPAVRDTSHGFWRRPLILTHSRKFIVGVDADPNLKAKLVETELAGVAAWAVKGALDLVDRGHYPDLQSSVAAVKTWKEEADSVASFASEHLVADPAERFRALKLYKTYQQWCRDHGRRWTGIEKFSKRLLKGNPRPLPSRATPPSAVLPPFMTGENRWQRDECAGLGLKRAG